MDIEIVLTLYKVLKKSEKDITTLNNFLLMNSLSPLNTNMIKVMVPTSYIENTFFFNLL